MSHLIISQTKAIIEFGCHEGILGITNGGGGGHQKAMEAMVFSFKKENTDQTKVFKVVDIVKDSFPTNLGELIFKKINTSWNNAKKNGNIKKQEYLVRGKCFKKGPSNQQLAELIFFIPIFISSFFRLMFNKKITMVIDTQPIGTKAIIRSIRLINFIFKRHIVFKKVLTDLPTSDATHYASSLKNLSTKDKKILEVISTKPLIENKSSEKKWWNDHFGLTFDLNNPSKSHVKYMEFPLRPAFNVWKDKELTGNHPHIQIKINNLEELNMISSCMNKTFEKKKVQQKEILHHAIEENDFIGLITLGSQASNKTKEYAENLIEAMYQLSEKDLNKKFYFFFACGEHKEKKIDLFNQIFELNKKIPDSLKEKFFLVPMGFQDDDELAALMHRADVGIYSTGGLTCMEVLTTSKGKVFLHSDSDLKSQNSAEIEKKLLDGLALWEKGNARYLIKEKNANMTSPGNYFKKQFADFLTIPKGV